MSFADPFTAKSGKEWKKCLSCENVSPADANPAQRPAATAAVASTRESLDAQLLLKLLDLVADIHKAVCDGATNKRARTGETEN